MLLVSTGKGVSPPVKPAMEVNSVLWNAPFYITLPSTAICAKGAAIEVLLLAHSTQTLSWSSAFEKIAMMENLRSFLMRRSNGTLLNSPRADEVQIRLDDVLSEAFGEV